MKKFLENSPAVALISACVACIGATVAVISFFYERDLSNKSAMYESEIRELSSQISSIERGIPVEGARRFNVASSLINENQMLILSDEFEAVISGLLSVAVPERESWAYDKFNEISVAGSQFDDVCRDKFLNNIKDAVLPPNIKPVFVWHKRESSSAYMDIPAQSPFKECDHLRIFPSITVYEIDADWIKNNIKFFSFHVPPDKLSKEKIETLIKDPASMMSDPDTATTYMNQDNKFFSEFTGPFLFHKFYEMLTLSTILPEASPRVVTIEKALNTLYFHNRYRISMSLDEKKMNDKVNVVVDDEYFVMSTEDSAVVVNITLPVLEGHHNNFVWTQGWLSGLRVQSPLLQ